MGVCCALALAEDQTDEPGEREIVTERPVQLEHHAIDVERTKLRKVLKRWDLIGFTFVALIGVDAVSSLTSYGKGEIFFWMAVAALLYLLPSGLLAAEMGTAFPVEGGPYAWPRLAFGRTVGAFTAVFYWMANPIWIGGTLAAAVVATLGSGLMFDSADGIGTVWSIVVGVAVVWAITGFAIVELKWGKLAGIIGALVRAIVIVVFVGLVVWFLVKNGKPAGTITLSSMKPSLAGFLAVFGLLQFMFVGFELSNSAGEEMRDARRDVPAMIGRSGILIMLANYVFLTGILLVIPLAQLSNVSGFVGAFDAVSGVLGGAQGSMGWIIGVLLILVTVTTGGVWIQGSARCVAVAGLDGAAPLVLGKFSKAGTPIVMNIVSGIIGTIFVVLVFTLTSGSLGAAFAVMFSLTISLTAFPYFFIFPAAIVLRKKYPDIRRPYKVPGGMVGLWACVTSTMFVLVVTVMALVWPGSLESLLGRPYSIVDSWGTSRFFFESVTLGTLAVIIASAYIFALVGRRNVAKGIVSDNDLLENLDVSPATSPGVTELEPVPVGAS